MIRQTHSGWQHLSTAVANVLILCTISVFPNLLLAAEAPRRPNIILILGDDFGYGDVGCYGQKRIKTPNLDRMAKEGLKYQQFYAGCTVCAPSRCSLMTGLHTGHCWVRGNRDPELSLRPEDVTIATLLKKGGYTTGLIGKWGLGPPETTGQPNSQGFDYFYGYATQMDAHNYYPESLRFNTGVAPLPENVQYRQGVAKERVTYAPDRFTDEAMVFIESLREKPFFLFLSYPLPHANNERGQLHDHGMEVPDDKPYSAERWPEAQRNHAAMITRLDAGVGRILDKVKQLGLDSNTIIVFSSDNGPHKEAGADPAFFQSSGPFKGFKRDLTEGGIRVPCLVRWPNVIRGGQVSRTPAALWDLLPTFAELGGVAAPGNLDGHSLAQSWLGKRPQPEHEYLYWEFHERGFQQAILKGNWKGIRRVARTPIELYDLSTDPHEDRNIAQSHPDVVKELEQILQKARTPTPYWPGRPIVPTRR